MCSSIPLHHTYTILGDFVFMCTSCVSVVILHVLCVCVCACVVVSYRCKKIKQGTVTISGQSHRWIGIIICIWISCTFVGYSNVGKLARHVSVWVFIFV